jgi:hypothetical protein
VGNDQARVAPYGSTGPDEARRAAVKWRRAPSWRRFRSSGVQCGTLLAGGLLAAAVGACSYLHSSGMDFITASAQPHLTSAFAAASNFGIQMSPALPRGRPGDRRESDALSAGLHQRHGGPAMVPSLFMGFFSDRASERPARRRALSAGTGREHYPLVGRRRNTWIMADTYRP